MSNTASRMNLPEQFSKTITDTFGDEGKEFLNQLPKLIEHWELEWGIFCLPPYPNLSYNYVAPADRPDSTELVLKLGVPNAELTFEVEALRFYGGRGAVRLVRARADQGAVLLERIRPATPLSDLGDDDAATEIAAQVMRELWRPAPENSSFPTVEQWAAGMRKLRENFGGRTGPFDAKLVDLSERLFEDLIPSQGERVLLHGDLHHYNIVQDHLRGWLAIDPKGVIGEREYEVGALLRNPVPQVFTWPDLEQITARRIDQLAELLDFDKQRLIKWAMAQAVVSAWWSYEDSTGGIEEMMRLAGIFARMIK